MRKLISFLASILLLALTTCGGALLPESTRHRARVDGLDPKMLQERIAGVFSPISPGSRRTRS